MYEDFSNVCFYSPSSLLENGFCKKIICNDKDTSHDVELNRYAYEDKHLEDSILNIDCTYVVVNKFYNIYVLDMNINGKKISTELTSTIENEYEGFIYYNDENLFVKFVTNGELVITHYIKSEDASTAFEFSLKK